MNGPLEMKPGMHAHHQVVIIGGGFGGLAAAQALKNAPVAVTLIDRRNFHLFQPLLYQVATGGLSATHIASPLREVLKRQKNASVLLGEVADIVPARKVVAFEYGEIAYDTLIVAAGTHNDYFGRTGWREFAPGLKTIEDAADIRRRILWAFEQAENEQDPLKRNKWLTLVVIGGGPTGVELSGAIAELATHTLRDNFRRIDPAATEIILAEAADRLLPMYPPSLSEKAAASLRALGVSVQLNARIIDVQSDRVLIRDATGERAIASRTILWTAGVRVSPLATTLARHTGMAVDAKGRVCVTPHLSLPGHPDIFVIGDMASLTKHDGSTLPGVAPVAIQQGRYVARCIMDALLVPTRKPEPFRYVDRGSMTTIGRSKAVADLHWCRLSGMVAWLVWLIVHLMGLVSYENRMLVFLQWAWNYFTRNCSARLITGVRSDTDLVDTVERRQAPRHHVRHEERSGPGASAVDPHLRARIIIDGSCRFCRRWGKRVERFSGIPHTPFQMARELVLGITERDAAQGLILVHHDGSIHRGAAAILKAIAERKGFAWMYRLYERIPNFRSVSNRLYRYVAERRHQL